MEDCGNAAILKVCKGEGMGNEVRGKPRKCGVTDAKSVSRRKKESVVIRVAESFCEDWRVCLTPWR